VSWSSDDGGGSFLSVAQSVVMMDERS